MLLYLLLTCILPMILHKFVASWKGKQHIDKELIVWIIVATFEGSSKTIPYWVLIGFL